MSPHVIDSFELFALIKVDLWSWVIIKLVVVFKELVAESVPHDVGVDDIQINYMTPVLGFLILVSLLTLDEFNGLNR